MEDQQGDAGQLVRELDEARRRIAALEASLAERERAEKALRESEQHHRRLAENGAEEIARRKEAEVELLRIRKAVDGATDAIGIGDLDENPIYLNAALVELFGYTAEELHAAGGPVVVYCNPEDAHEVFTTIRRGESWTGEVPMRTRQGRALSIFLRANAIFDESGNIIGLIGIHTDITERKKAEQALRESEQHHRRLAKSAAEEIARRKEAEVELLRIRKAVDSATDGIGIADLDGNSVYHNAALVELFGYTAEEMRAAAEPTLVELCGYTVEEMRAATGPIFAYCNPEDAHKVFAAVLRGESWTGEVLMRTRQGRTLSIFLRANAIFDESGNIVGMVGIHTDITEHNKNAQALYESEERYRSLVETTSDWVWEVDRDAVYTYASPKVKDFLGYEPEEVLGKTPFDFMEPDDARRLAKWFSGKTESPQAFAGLENMNRHKDGRRVVLETSGVPLSDDQGRFAGFRGIDRDVTKRKLAEETIEKEQQLLRELLSMQERDRKLIAYEIHDGLAQQLAGALLRFQAYSELADLHGEEAQGTFDAAMALLGNGMDETRRLIDGLRPPILDESGVAAAIEYLVCEMRERCSLEIEYIVDVHFDRLAFPLEGALFRVVQESLTNACRHSKSKSIRVQLLHQDDRVIIEVQDWGVGFDPKDVPDTRFGLHGIQERARLLGGTATVDSAPGKGTRIHVELPLVAKV